MKFSLHMIPRLHTFFSYPNPNISFISVWAIFFFVHSVFIFFFCALHSIQKIICHKYSKIIMHKGARTERCIYELLWEEKKVYMWGKKEAKMKNAAAKLWMRNQNARNVQIKRFNVIWKVQASKMGSNAAKVKSPFSLSHKKCKSATIDDKHITHMMVKIGFV